MRPTVPFALAALLALGSVERVARAQGTLTLGEAIGMAHAASPDLRAAVAEIDRADAEHDKAISAYLPRLSASVSGGGQIVRDTLPPIRAPFTLEPYDLRAGSADGRADLRWTLWDFGKTSGAAGAAARTRDARAHGASAAKAEVTRAAATLFLTVIYDAQLVDSKKISLRHRARHAALAKALVDKGVRAPIDEARARLHLEAARQDVAAAEGRLLVDRAKLAEVLGVDPDALGVPAKPVLPSMDEAPRAAAARAERSRPEIAAAAASVLAGEETLDAARAQYLPSLSLSGTGSYRLTRYDVEPNAVPRAEVSGQLTITVPIFDAHTPAAVAEARASLAATEAKETLLRRRAKTEAAVAALELRTARALDARARDLATSTQAALGVVEARYQSGLASPLELVDAETSDLDARDALFAAEYRRQVATVDLAIATGRAALLGGRP
ncbi:MAG: TolC family protein [Labilithrix sp.]|nr:TolC family protein [Labilithrix sp.]